MNVHFNTQIQLVKLSFEIVVISRQFILLQIKFKVLMDKNEFNVLDRPMRMIHINTIIAIKFGNVQFNIKIQTTSVYGQGSRAQVQTTNTKIRFSDCQVVLPTISTRQDHEMES